MFRATLKSLLSRKVRLVLSGLAVVLGVMAVSGALIVTDTLGRGFDSLFRTVFADLDVQVTGVQAVGADNESQDPVNTLVPAAVVDRITAVPGVVRARGSVFEEGARLIGADGKPIESSGPPSFGVDWAGEDGLVELRSGRGPQRADEIAINAGLAATSGYGPSDTVDVLTPAGRKSFTISGVFGYSGDRDSFGGETRIAFTQPVAQQLMLGSIGGFTAVDVEGAGDQEALRDRIAEALGSGYTVRTGDEVADEQAAELGAFIGVIRNVLLGFAGVTLFVGIFLILNTFSIVLAQRTRELALLRSLGASRGQVIRSVLLEAVVIGLVAATLGLGAGFGVAALLKMLMEAQSGANLPVEGLTTPISAVIAAYAVGVIVTVVAALLPAMRASRIPPIAAMRDAATPDKPLTKLTVAGAVLTAAGIGIGLLGSLWALLGGVLLGFVGIAMLTPVIARPAVWLLGAVLAWSIPGKLGRHNSARNPRRTAITAAALMVGTALVTGVAVLASSLTTSIERQVTRDLGAELVISGPLGRGGSPTFDPDVIEQAKRIPGVAEAVAVSTDVAQTASGTTPVIAADVPALVAVFNLKGSLRALQPGEIVVDDAFGADLGDTVMLTTPRGGSKAYKVVGIHEQTDLVPGPILANAEGFRSPRASRGYIDVADGADVAAVTAQVRNLLANEPEVSVQDQSGFADQQTGQVDTIVLMLYVLLGLAIIIAVLGIVNTLALSIVERTRELGLLRAIGADRRLVRRMIVVESVVIAVFGALLGVLVGSGLGAAVAGSLDNITTLSWPWASISAFLGLAVVVGLLAAVIPAFRASRINVLGAIAYE
jgi:putative ABC transport system permease protein